MLCPVYPPETLFSMAVLLGCFTLVFDLGLILIGLGYIFALVGVNKFEGGVFLRPLEKCKTFAVDRFRITGLQA